MKKYLQHTSQLIFCLLATISWQSGFSQERSMETYDYNFTSFENIPKPLLSDELYSLSEPSSFAHPEFGINPFNTSCEDCMEIIDKRTIDTRYYVKNNSGGKIFYSQKSYGPLHFKDKENRWLTIDHRLFPKGNSSVYQASSQPIPVTIDLENGFSSLVLSNGQHFVFNRNPKLFWNIGGQDHLISNPYLQKATAGHDGVINFDFWPGIDRQQLVNRGEIKTDFVLHGPPEISSPDGWLVIEDNIKLPEGLSIKRNKDGIISEDGYWYGDLLLVDNTGKKLAKIERPLVYESAENHNHTSGPVSWYEMVERENEIVIRILVSMAWLQSPERNYPVTIDPLVIGINTYNVGYMGFPFDATCFDLTNYCSYPLTVTVPGTSTLTDAMFDARYVSKNGGCGLFNNCIKKEAAFKILGPCGASPNATGYWSCTTLPQANLAGVCYGDSLPMFQTIDCLAPSCPDHVINFEMRTFHCSCPLPVCDTVCHIMRPGTWTITIEARTLEGKVNGATTKCLGNSATLTATGYFGVPPYTYFWMPGGMTTQSVTVTPGVTTTYTCTITDTCGIWVDTSATVTILPLPSINFSTTDVFCSGGTNGTATATGSGTPAPYSYVWNTNPSQSTQTATGLTSAYYTVTVTDGLGCKSSDSVFVGVTNVFGISGVASDVTCNGFNDGETNISVVIGQSPYSYIWSTSATSEDLTGLGPGIYSVTVTDGNGCMDTLSLSISEPDSIVVDAGTGKTILAGETVTLNGSYTPSGSYIVTWSPPSNLSDPNILNPIASPPATTTYTLTITSSLNAACFKTDTVTIQIIQSAGISLPNAFSPNNDGTNDVFFNVPDVEIVRLQVFNRWGESVYDGNSSWDGKYNGQPQPVGTYAFRAIVKLPDSGTEFTKQGNVTLLR